MKVKAHVRVGRDPRGKHKIAVTSRPNPFPLEKGNGEVLPTVAFAVEFEVPDSAFREAERVLATVVIPEDRARVAAEVRVA